MVLEQWREMKEEIRKEPGLNLRNFHDLCTLAAHARPLHRRVQPCPAPRRHRTARPDGHLRVRARLLPDERPQDGRAQLAQAGDPQEPDAVAFACDQGCGREAYPPTWTARRCR